MYMCVDELDSARNWYYMLFIYFIKYTGKYQVGGTKEEGGGVGLPIITFGFIETS